MREREGRREGRGGEVSSDVKSAAKFMFGEGERDRRLTALVAWADS